MTHNSALTDIRDLEGMMAAIAHRGPDGQGTWQSPQAALGHRRLAIIDLAGGRERIEKEHQ